MGSAIIKPLTRRRGKVKANGSNERSVVWSTEGNANDSCHPSAYCGENADSVKDLPEPNSGKQAESKSRDISQDGVTTDSLKELAVTIPRTSSANTQSNNQTASSAKPQKGLSILNRCFFSKVCPTSLQAATLSSRCPGESTACKTNGVPSQIIMEASTEGNNTRQACNSPVAETLSKSSGNLVQVTENASDVDINSTAALAVHTTGLSPDQIGSIRKQLYTEGFNPAEREGGVAFFIPVTEDGGLHPQTDRTSVAERLTKKKRASLSYEERMMLANINRQVQLSKRKEFSVRDIRNVKIVASTTDISDRTKQDDDINTDFDVSTLNAKITAPDLNVCCPKKAVNDAEFEAWVTKKAAGDSEFEESLIKKMACDKEIVASATKKAMGDGEFGTSFPKKASNDAIAEASLPKKGSNEAVIDVSLPKKGTSDAECDTSAAKKVTRDADLCVSDQKTPRFDAENNISLPGKDG